MTDSPDRTVAKVDFVTRRDFLRAAGTTLAASALPGVVEAQRTSLPTHPNLLIILSEQERYPRYWPAEWASWSSSVLPAHARLLQNGLKFTNAFCNASMCAPSRACLFTGLYAQEHGLVRTGNAAYQLPAYVQTMGKMLASAGYNVQLRGKWHMSYNNAATPPTYPPTSTQVSAYGFQGWVPTNAGEGTETTGYGGGCAGNDVKTVDQAVAFLTSPEAAARPFALIVATVNPHDVLAYPGSYVGDTCGGKGYGDLPAIPDLGIKYSDTPTRTEDLSKKPTAQSDALALFAAGLGPIGTPTSPPGNTKPRDYVNFYAYLHQLADLQIGRVLDAVKNPDDPTRLRDDVVVLFTADHGEMGLSHNGMRQKMYNAYEETMHVPLVISNPILFPTPQTTNALASLVDVMPTVATIANVPDRSAWHFSGVDLSPLFTNPGGSVQDHVLFTFDDEDAGQATPPPAGLAVRQPNHIRCVREARWKYARYFDPSGAKGQQEELYDLQAYPDETLNLGDSSETSVQNEKARLVQVLAKLEATKLFSDNPLVEGRTPIKAAHITELRQRVADLRTKYSLAAITWTDPGLAAGAAPIRPAHVTELRTALDEVYVQAVRTPPTYTDAVLTPGVTFVSAAHISELRAAIIALW